MIETRRLKNTVIFFQTILNFVLSSKTIIIIAITKNENRSNNSNINNNDDNINNNNIKY